MGLGQNHPWGPGGGGILLLWTFQLFLFNKNTVKFSNTAINRQTIVSSAFYAALVMKYFIQGRNYSTISSSIDEDFYEWFCGFTDSEGSFMIERRLDSYLFKFKIHLHIDDIEVLYFIQKTLGVGKVSPNGVASAIFRVRKQEDVAKIIDIFSKSIFSSVFYTTSFMKYFIQ